MLLKSDQDDLSSGGKQLEDLVPLPMESQPAMGAIVDTNTTEVKREEKDAEEYEDSNPFLQPNDHNEDVKNIEDAFMVRHTI